MPVTHGRSRTARYGNFPHLGASGCHLYRRSLVPCSPALALISARAEGVSTLVPPMLYAMYAYYVTCSRTSVLFTGIINIALALISARAEGSHFCALYRSSVCVCLHPFRFRLHQIQVWKQCLACLQEWLELNPRPHDIGTYLPIFE